jgi:acyl transferase domain-containing protein
MTRAQEYLEARKLKGQVRLSLKQKLPVVTAQNGTTNGYLAMPERKLFTLSAFDKASGKQQVHALRAYLARLETPEFPNILENLEYTLNYRRSVLGWKYALHARTREELICALESEPVYIQSSKTATVAFCFTGQGAQWYV